MDCIINHEQFQVTLIRKKVKKTRLSVIGNRIIQITSRERLTEKQVQAMMVTYFDWIMKQLRTRTFLLPNQMMVVGTIYELRHDHTLKVPYEIEGPTIIYREGGLDVLIKEHLKIIETLAYQLSAPYGVVDIRFRTMKTRWGVCHIQKKRIVFNTALYVLPQDCITYVIYHELTHFHVSNHQKPFYEALSLVYPNYRVTQKQMKEYVLPSFISKKG